MQQGRLFGIVYYLLDHRRVTAPALAERFEVSVRTIYRDIEALGAVGIPVCTEPGRGGGISLIEGYVLDRSLISKAEQQQILLALQSVAATAQVDSNALLEKLGGLFGGVNTDWIAIDFSCWGGSHTESERFSLLKTAILEKETLSCSYLSAKGECAQRRIKPARLVYKAREWYLQGFCLLREEYRTFKISRIRSIQRTGEHFSETLCPPSIGTIASDERSLLLQLRFAPELAYRVYDEFDPDLIEITPDGSLLAASIQQESQWLYGYLLSFGGGLEVLSPESVRRHLFEEAKKIANVSQNPDRRCQDICVMIGANEQEEMKMEMKFCQSCAMPLQGAETFGTNADQSKNEEYCSYCYQNGKFTADCTMQEMIAFCAPHMTTNNPDMTAEQAIKMMNEFFPALKRWKKAN